MMDGVAETGRGGTGRALSIWTAEYSTAFLGTASISIVEQVGDFYVGGDAGVG